MSASADTTPNPTTKRRAEIRLTCDADVPVVGPVKWSAALGRVALLDLLAQRGVTVPDRQRDDRFHRAAQRLAGQAAGKFVVEVDDHFGLDVAHRLEPPGRPVDEAFDRLHLDHLILLPLGDLDGGVQLDGLDLEGALEDRVEALVLLADRLEPAQPEHPLRCRSVVVDVGEGQVEWSPGAALMVDVNHGTRIYAVPLPAEVRRSAYRDSDAISMSCSARTSGLNC